MKLSEACKKELEAAAAREDGRLSPMAWERHRAALMRRGLIGAQSIITDAGREFLRHNAKKYTAKTDFQSNKAME